MTHMTIEETRARLLAAFATALEAGTSDNDTKNSRMRNVWEGWDWADDLYEPDDALIRRIGDYNLWKKTRAGEDPGQLMEEISYLAFRRLRDFSSIQSYQSYSVQHDLVVSGAGGLWLILLFRLGLPLSHRTIVAEAKNLDEKVDDAQFSRLCFTLQNKFDSQCCLGVIVSRLGATGFPDLDNPGSKRLLRDAYATQVLFHAKTGKYVVVLDDSDIQRLTEVGGLAKVLGAKIRAVEEAGHLPVPEDGSWQQVSLPAHLAKYGHP